MKRITEVILMAVACTAFPVYADSIEPQPASYAAGGLARAVDEIFADRNKATAPGCVVGVRHDGSVDVVSSYGSADLEHQTSNQADTSFEAGSISKQFTAASILVLAEQGRLQLTDDVRKFIPELPDYGTPITLNALLSHTAGLRDWGDVEALAGWPRTSRIYSLADVLAVLARQKNTNFPPGTAYSYSNSGYNVLAIVVERVGGSSLAQFSQQHLFSPLGMTHTQWRDNYRRVVKDRAIAYELVNGSYEQAMPFTNDIGAGGLLTTVGDLLIWNDALSNGKLGAFVTTEMHRQGRLDNGRLLGYARGLSVESYRGNRELSHSGATGGYVAWLGRYPEKGLSIALLCNAGDINPIARAHQIAGLFFGAPAPSAGLTLSEDQVSGRAGLFIDERMGLPLRIDAQGAVLRVVGGPKLVATSLEDFTAGSTSFRFKGNDQVTRESADGEVTVYHRERPWTPTPSDLRGFVGGFQSDEAMAVSRVTMRGDSLVVVPADRPSEVLITRPLMADKFEYFDSNIPGPLQPKGVLRFTRDAKGRVNGFMASTAGVREMHFRRVTTHPAATGSRSDR